MRQKPEQPLLTEPQVDELLGEYRRLIDEVNINNARLDAKITQLKELVRITLYPLKKRVIVIKDQVLNYIWLHRADFGSPRSKTLTHGAIGVRKIRDDKFNVKDHDVAVAAIRAAGLPDILIAVKETVDLKALAAHLKEHPGDLAKVTGVTRPDEDDEPWFEVSTNS